MLGDVPALFKIPVRIHDATGTVPKATCLECQNCGALFPLEDYGAGEFETIVCPNCDITEYEFLELKNG